MAADLRLDRIDAEIKDVFRHKHKETPQQLRARAPYTAERVPVMLDLALETKNYGDFFKMYVMMMTKAMQVQSHKLSLEDADYQVNMDVNEHFVWKDGKVPRPPQQQIDAAWDKLQKDKQQQQL